MPFRYLLIGGSPDAGAAPMVNFIPFLLIFLIFYFMLIRPQQKRVQEHHKLVDSLKKGDSVVTESGMFGTIVGVHEDAIVLKVAENVKVRFMKSKVAGRVESTTVTKKS